MNSFLRIAASQFPVSHDMAKNYKFIKRLIEEASENDVEAIHFPETALPGYLSNSKGNSTEFDCVGRQINATDMKEVF